MPQGIPPEVIQLPPIDHFANDAPVDCDQVADFELVEIGFLFEPPVNRPEGSLSQMKLSVFIDKRFAFHRDSGAVDLLHRSPADAAGIDTLKGVFALFVAGALPDVEDVEGVMGDGALLDLGGQAVERFSSQSVFEPEPFAQMPIELFLGDILQQFIADPVGLNDPLVKGIPDLVRVRNVEQVRVHRLKSGEELYQSGVGHAFPNVSKDFGIGVGPAVMQAVGTEGVAAGAQKSVHHIDDIS